MICSKTLNSVFFVIKVGEDSKNSENLSVSISEVVEAAREACGADKDDLMVYILETEKNSRFRRDVRI